MINSNSFHHAFCDFDDTIIKNTCLLYSKYKFLTNNLSYSPSEAYCLLKKDIVFNPAFFDLVKKYKLSKLTILSLNDKNLIANICADFKHVFGFYGVEVVSIYGSIPKKNKITLISPWALYIADIFESSYASSQSWFTFISVDGQYSLVKYWLIYIRKLYKYLCFRAKFLNI